ncbi:MAG TPA: outer membrane protein assembly factor BamD [Dongiaceae bacterium]|nr:outer membrane protein assembly factor BamD [Dongiaceae bacterium]
MRAAAVRIGKGLAMAALLAIALGGAAPAFAKSKKPKPSTIPPEEVYAEAIGKITKKRYFAARAMLQELLPRIPPEDRDLLPRVQLAIADAFFKDGGLTNYGESLNAYRNFLTYFPQHPQAAYAQLMVGQSLYRQVTAPDRDQTTTIKAIDELRKVQTGWPGTPEAQEAQAVTELCNNRLAEKERLVGAFYQKRKVWLAALDRYQKVTENYPRYPGMSRLLLDLGKVYLAINQREQAQDAFTRLAARDGSKKLSNEAETALKAYDRRREKEGENLYGGLSDKDKKPNGTKP